MTVVYDDTEFFFFDLLAFFFGCTTQDLAPASCTVSATCINTANSKQQQVASQSFNYVATGGLTQQMVQAKPVGFKGCQTVNFTTTGAGGSTIITVHDTISYILYGIPA